MPEEIFDDGEKYWRREIERRLAKLETDRAVETERYGSILRRLDKIESIMSKLMWLVVTVIIAGMLKFVIDGGLNIPTP